MHFGDSFCVHCFPQYFRLVLFRFHRPYATAKLLPESQRMQKLSPKANDTKLHYAFESLYAFAFD